MSEIILLQIGKKKATKTNSETPFYIPSPVIISNYSTTTGLTTTTNEFLQMIAEVSFLTHHIYLLADPQNPEANHD